MKRLSSALCRWLCQHRYHYHSHLKGGGIMFIVKDDHPSVRYALDPVTATDAEGSPIPGATIDVVMASDNPSAVLVTPDVDPHAGDVSFGSPNPDGTPAVANLTATYMFGDRVLGIKGAQIVVTAGDPAAISGGDIQLEGLTEAPAPPTP